jgi:glyoxylase-like metal-dependent hydrolase (beta-lactamase superfamily II)/ferredoxin
MADRSAAVPENVPGPFFVDTRCINCDACRQLAPSVFGETEEFSFVKRQPEGDADRRAALRAVLACPTGAIGSPFAAELKEVRGDFPLPLDEGLYYCGFNSEKSFGGNSYFLRRPEGNWLIDSPRYVEQLARTFAEWGGIDRIFLTHRDDVADAEKFARRFGAKRVIHRRELAAQPEAEIVIEGDAPQQLAPGLTAIPTPGHTAGHMVLLADDRYLFTGDHLWWVPEDEEQSQGRLGASKSYCWWSWPRQIESLALLGDYTFEWVLPGHGHRIHLPPDAMQRKLLELVDRVDVRPARAR